MMGIFVLKCYEFVFHGMEKPVPGGRWNQNLTHFRSVEQAFHIILAHQTWDGTRPSHSVPSHPTY
ncbi:hypothetical protein DVH24_027815 [Malus domestica]|uniref:Uncharacterized protein n=1 Tax=Malus domestica TaxID=3750 RepID=A0A498H8E3_MALDO|nr:hypothetical protein DVH24_027815 [Malus domestica]